MDSARELAELLESQGKLDARCAQDLVRGVDVALEPRLREPEREREGDETLLRAVVEVALEAPALRVAGLDDARTRREQLLARLGVRQRGRDEARERTDPRLGLEG